MTAPVQSLCSNMRTRTRKLIGTVVLLAFLALYAWAAAAIGAGRITLAPHWAQLAYFVAAGLVWVVPAALLIRWMQRPD
jgi:hypothetical protein